MTYLCFWNSVQVHNSYSITTPTGVQYTPVISTAVFLPILSVLHCCSSIFERTEDLLTKKGVMSSHPFFSRRQKGLSGDREGPYWLRGRNLWEKPTKKATLKCGKQSCFHTAFTWATALKNILVFCIAGHIWVPTNQLCQQAREKLTQSMTSCPLLLQTLRHLSRMRCYFYSSSFKHMLRLLPNASLLIRFKLCILGVELWNNISSPDSLCLAHVSESKTWGRYFARLRHPKEHTQEALMGSSCLGLTNTGTSVCTPSPDSHMGSTFYSTAKAFTTTSLKIHSKTNSV